MPQEVGELSSTDVRMILKRITGRDFTYSNERPEDSVFTLRDHNISYIESLSIEWCLKNPAGILLLSEPITRVSFWNLPEDIELADMARDEVLEEIADQYKHYLESLAQGVYLTNSKYGTKIKQEGDKEPRLVAFLGNHTPEQAFITTASAMYALLPRLQMSA
jgi:hypothetical protein